MPFSATNRHTAEHWDSHFENFLKPLIESCGDIEVFRSVPLRQDIQRQIVNDLVFSHIVVADLTDSNPNVFLELGIRLSFKHGTVTIAEEGFVPPFHLTTKAILKYSRRDPEKYDFGEQLKKAILDCCSNPRRPDSAVLETITGRGSVYSIIHQEELIRRVDALLLEYSNNLRILKHAYEIILENKSKRFKILRRIKRVLVVPLTASAVELLWSERYLEEDSEFYDVVGEAVTTIGGINRNIERWSYEQSDNVEEWFIDNRDMFNHNFQQYGQLLNDVKKRVASYI